MPTTLHYSDPPWICLRQMPGRYNVESGYVYALICSRGVVKIGSAVHPRWRIGEQCYGGFLRDACFYPKERRVRVNQIILSGTHRRCRDWEKAIHCALKPYQIGHYRSEKYRPAKPAMEALTQLFAKPLSGKRIAGFTKALYP